MLLLALTVVTAALASVATAVGPSAGQNLIVLLIDGYGALTYNRTDPKLQQAFSSLAKHGVQAEYLKPVFPTQSYPNWESLATGRYVDSHNVTADYLYDSTRNIYFQHDEGLNDTDFWRDVPSPSPIWKTIGKASIDVHCYYFANCHRPHGDLLVQVPAARRHTFKNEQTYDLYAHIPKIVRHLKKYQSYRQQLVLMRYNGVARALRLFGEDSDAGKQALSSADANVRKLQESLEDANLFETTNLIVLSDFGLRKINEEQQFFVDECLADVSRIRRVANSLAFMFIYPGVYRKAEIPERFHWKDSRFIAPIVLIARPGAVLLTTQIPTTDVSEAYGRELRMLSGYDNEDAAMHGIFMARGPAFKKELLSPPIEVVDVYPLVLSLMGVDAKESHNGSWDRVAESEILVDDWQYQPNDSDVGSLGGPNQQLVVFFVSFLLLLYYATPLH